MIKRTFLLLLAVPIYLFAIAQAITDVQFPKIIPPSPDAAALGKYGQIPVDKSTGVPSISIPIYEIKTPRFTLPITLSYHASGIKVDEIASWVGLGWSLNAGGVITRTVMGLPDGIINGNTGPAVIRAASIQWPRDSLYLQSASNYGQDTQPDDFFYNFNNVAGAFVFGSDHNPVLSPYKAIRITYDTTSGFTITDEEGNRYNFNSKERVEHQVAVGTEGMPVSSWYLTRMISADCSDTIQFVYTTDATPINSFSFNFTEEYSYNYGASVSSLGARSLRGVLYSNSEYTYTPTHLSSIRFNGGKVDFIPKTGRLDNASVQLDSIIVYNYSASSGQYVRMKKFKLQTGYSYSTITSSNPFVGIIEPFKYRLILSGLVENSDANVAAKTYHFDYNSGMLPPLYNFGQDKWGYYNGHYDNQSLLEGQQIIGDDGTTVYNMGDPYAANRNVSPTDMQAGMLQKITYPTKGYTTFDFECNRQEGLGTTRSSTSVSAIGYWNEQPTTSYTFTMLASETGGTIFHVHIRKTSDLTVTLPVNPYVQLVRVSDGAILYTASANPNTDFDEYRNISLDIGQQYQLIAVARGGTSGTPTSMLPTASISTSYEVNTTTLNALGGLRIASIKNYEADGALLSTETYKYGTNEEGGGKFLSQGYFNTNKLTHSCWYYVPMSTLPNTVWFNAAITSYFNNSIYPLSTLNGSPVVYGAVTVYHGDALQNTGKSFYNYAIELDSPLVCPSVYQNGVKPIPMNWKMGEPTREAHFRNAGDGQYILEREKLTNYNLVSKPAAWGTLIGYGIEWRGGNVSIFLRWTPGDFYFFDYPFSSGVRVPAQTVVNDYDSTGNAVVFTDTTSFFYDNPTLYLPTRTIRTDSKGATRLLYTYRPLDKTVINSLTPLSTQASVAIDSMVARNIIAPVVQQAEYRNGSLTQLELTNYQIWDSHVIAPVNIQTKLGANPLDTRIQFNKYDAAGNILEQQKANDVKEVYLWGYRGLFPVAKVQNSTFDVAKNYIIQSVLDNPSSDAVMSTQLNNLRAIPNALVTSFTFNPLVGITSQMDPQGKTTYYEYDGVQRLKCIRDKDGNIIKTIDYHYKGQ